MKEDNFVFARNVRPAVSLLLLMTAICGLVYPIAVTGISRMSFPAQAAGSLVFDNGTLIGSRLIGQSFSDPRYFWGRPSATTPQPYNALASTGSNLGPLNPALVDQVKAAAKRLRDADPGNPQPIPIELVTASASGLDPEISLAAANFQAARVAGARGLPVTAVQKHIAAHTERRVWGLLGESRVNVLELNRALDTLR